VDRPEPDESALPIPSREEATKPPLIFPVPVTDQELIAQTKKIGDRLAEDFPADPRAMTLAGHICWAMDEPAKAVASWEKCTQLHPDCAAAWTALGMDAFRKGDFEKAAECLQKSYRLTPEMGEGDLFMMVDALMSAGKPEEVVAVIAPLRKTRLASARAAWALGHAYLQLKEYEKAKKELLEAATLDPHSPQVHFALAQTLARLGDEPNAQKHREQYAKLKGAEMAAADGTRPDRLKADLIHLRRQAALLMAWTAQIYALHGNVDRAEQLWVASLAVDPNNVEARSRLKMLYSAQGRDEEAREVSHGSGRVQGPARKQ
jgi:tetratricopeptide (TPR) repeat protein